MSEQQSQAEDQSGFIMYLSRQALPIRLAAFFAFIILIVGVIVGLTIGLYYVNVTNFPRLIPFSNTENITLSEYMTLSDEEAYPAAVTVDTNGTLYTGSFVHGAVWQADSSGTPQEIPQTREQIGSVIGLDVAPDGNLTILDYLDAYNPSGAKIWQWDGDALTLVFDSAASDMTISVPNDIAVDSNGRIYLLDIVLGQIIAIEDDAAQIWWQAPEQFMQVAGLAYHSTNDSLIISDANLNSIYEIPVAASDPENERRTIFSLMDSSIDAPNFNGVTVGADGTVYVAALSRNEIWQIESDDSYTILAQNYRGSSDVAYDAMNNRLYVNNWDQSWLNPVPMLLIEVKMPPRLPFSVDVIDLPE